MDTLLVVAALLVPIALNLWATRLVCTDQFASKGQRRAQLALIWLLPFVGAILTLGVHRKNEPPSRKYRKEQDLGDDYTLSGKFVQKTADIVDGD